MLFVSLLPTPELNQKRLSRDMIKIIWNDQKREEYNELDKIFLVIFCFSVKYYNFSSKVRPRSRHNKSVSFFFKAPVSRLLAYWRMLVVLNLFQAEFYIIF